VLVSSNADATVNVCCVKNVLSALANVQTKMIGIHNMLIGVTLVFGLILAKLVYNNHRMIE
jgi:hypothetical protein